MNTLVINVFIYGEQEELNLNNVRVVRVMNGTNKFPLKLAINTSLSLSFMIIFLLIIMFDEIIVYEPNLFILYFEFVTTTVITILNFRDMIVY